MKRKKAITDRGRTLIMNKKKDEVVVGRSERRNRQGVQGTAQDFRLETKRKGLILQSGGWNDG